MVLAAWCLLPAEVKSFPGLGGPQEIYVAKRRPCPWELAFNSSSFALCDQSTCSKLIALGLSQGDQLSSLLAMCLFRALFSLRKVARGCVIPASAWLWTAQACPGLCRLLWGLLLLIMSREHVGNGFVTSFFAPHSPSVEFLHFCVLTRITWL